MRDVSRNKKILFFALLVVSLVLIAVAVRTMAVDEKTGASRDGGQNDVRARGAAHRVLDRKNTVLTSASTTPDTALLIQEIESVLGAEGEVQLSIDAELQDYISGALKDVAVRYGYAGGAGVIMDVRTGELVALTSYSQDGSPAHKATRGLFVPGSIIKPFIAIAALSEGLIDPRKKILSTGAIILTDQNGKRLYFNDWKAHGYVDMREAIGVSSNVYFYTIGGGYEGQRGLGIGTIAKYLTLFGIGIPTGMSVLSESGGHIPTPEWKAREFNGDEWRIADTYLASIGQHGYAVTPLQMTRAVAAIATEGEVVVPTITHDAEREVRSATLPLRKEYFKVVKEGMEYAVMNGTASGLYMDGITLAAKTGTAEVDTRREHIHSWLIGYFPSDTPKYAFTFLLDTGPWGEEIGAVSVAESVFTWMRVHRPEYVNSR